MFAPTFRCECAQPGLIDTMRKWSIVYRQNAPSCDVLRGNRSIFDPCVKKLWGGSHIDHDDGGEYYLCSFGIGAIIRRDLCILIVVTVWFTAQ